MKYQCLAAAILAVGLTCGCDDSQKRAREFRRQLQSQASRETTEQDHIGDAWGFMNQLAEVNEDAAAEQIMFHLNTWADHNSRKPNWQFPAKLVELLPARHRALCDKADRMQFLPQDLDHLRTCFIMKHITRWSTEGDRIDPVLDPWFNEQKKHLSADDWRVLDRASRIFDWTVRNVRLEEFIPTNQGATPKAMPEGLSYLGPGYRQTAFETIWHGSGDEWQRARVFIELCHQLEIDACFVAPLQNSAWRACGVRVGDQVYLFDSRLGIAIPGPGQVGIATLQQAQEDATVLRRMNVQGWFENYPGQKDQIQECIAMISARPESMTYRMAALQDALTGERRLQLSVDPVAIAERFMRCKGIKGTGLWSVPFDAILYHEAVMAARQSDPALDRPYVMTWGMLRIGTPLAIARWQHLMGDMAGDEDHAGALRGYQAARMTDTDINSLPVNVPLQIQLGVRRMDGESPEQFQYRITTAQQIFRNAKFVSSFWLGQLLIDTHRYETATTWLSDRFLESGGAGGIWEQPAEYGLARAYEHMKRIPEALELYKQTEGLPDQQHANRLRARLLEKLQSEK